MANFTFNATPKVLSADGNPWIDPDVTFPNPYFNPLAPPPPPATLDNTPTLAAPSRQNAVLGIPHRYDKFKVNVQMSVLLIPTGMFGVVPDSSLGGLLFQAWFAETPTGMFAWSSVPGFSVHQLFFPTVVGAYCAVFGRGGGGQLVWHFFVEP